jgi:hypothetical protein
MRAPAGATIVQTGLPLTAPASIAITGSVLEADIASGRPVRLETEIGPVNIILRLIRDF